MSHVAQPQARPDAPNQAINWLVTRTAGKAPAVWLDRRCHKPCRGENGRDSLSCLSSHSSLLFSRCRNLCSTPLLGAVSDFSTTSSPLNRRLTALEHIPISYSLHYRQNRSPLRLR